MKITQHDNGPVTIVFENCIEKLILYGALEEYSNSIISNPSQTIQDMKSFAKDMAEQINNEVEIFTEKEIEKNELVQD